MLSRNGQTEAKIAGRELVERWKQYFDGNQIGVENVGTGTKAIEKTITPVIAEKEVESTVMLKKVGNAIKHNETAGKHGIATELIRKDSEK